MHEANSLMPPIISSGDNLGGKNGVNSRQHIDRRRTAEPPTPTRNLRMNFYGPEDTRIRLILTRNSSRLKPDTGRHTYVKATFYAVSIHCPVIAMTKHRVT